MIVQFLIFTSKIQIFWVEFQQQNQTSFGDTIYNLWAS